MALDLLARAGGCRRRRLVLHVEPLDIGLCGGFLRAAGGELRDPQPILPGARDVALEPPDVAAFEQRVDRIGGELQRYVDIGERWVEPVEARDHLGRF